MQFTTELFIAPQIQEQRILQVHRCIAYGHKWQCKLFTHFQRTPANVSNNYLSTQSNIIFLEFDISM